MRAGYRSGWGASERPTRLPLRRGIKAHICPREMCFNDTSTTINNV